MEIRIYFEGNKLLKSGFDTFFSDLKRAAREAQSTLELVAAKDGLSAYRKAQRTHPQAWNVLLKDSEQPMPADWLQLCQRFGIDQGFVDRVFWMVELMESWFLANPKMLSDYYGVGFLVNSIGERVDVERVPKADVLRTLKQATRGTTKGEYSKVKHAPFLLEKLDSNRVRARAEHCRQLFQVITKLQR
jgi:hypothetical protein